MSITIEEFEKKQKNGNKFEVPYLGNTAIIEKKGAYGFWHITLENGVSPKQFEGIFTSVEEAKKAVVSALETRRKRQTDPNVGGKA